MSGAVSGVAATLAGLAALAGQRERQCSDADYQRAVALSAQAVLDPGPPGIHWHRVGGKQHVVLVVRSKP